ncbi:MAG: beta-3-deoxy-D-manno-oct-2-ulosonic acid transferase, partial [Pseudomonadota bacterium]
MGGTFWGGPWQGADQNEAPAGLVIVRSRDRKEADVFPEKPDCETILVPWPDSGEAPIDPWSILPQASRLIAHGDDEWIALACALKRPVSVVSPGRFGKPEDSPETLAQRAFEALCEPVRDPYGGGWLDPLAAIEQLSDWRRVLDSNRGPAGERIVAACGMNWWKRDEIRRFLWSPGAALEIRRSDQRAIAAA